VCGAEAGTPHAEPCRLRAKIRGVLSVEFGDREQVTRSEIAQGGLRSPPAEVRHNLGEPDPCAHKLGGKRVAQLMEHLADLSGARGVAAPRLLNAIARERMAPDVTPEFASGEKPVVRSGHDPTGAPAEHAVEPQCANGDRAPPATLAGCDTNGQPALTREVLDVARAKQPSLGESQARIAQEQREVAEPGRSEHETAFESRERVFVEGSGLVVLLSSIPFR